MDILVKDNADINFNLLTMKIRLIIFTRFTIITLSPSVDESFVKEIVLSSLTVDAFAFLPSPIKAQTSFIHGNFPQQFLFFCFARRLNDYENLIHIRNTAHNCCSKMRGT